MSSEAGHTPGSWRYEWDPRRRHLILPHDEPNVALGEAFAQATTLSYGRRQAPYPAAENACLMAAAPDLLEAAKLALEVINPRLDRIEYYKLEAAVNKAEGDA